MTIQVSTTDARTAKALAILDTADRWLKIRRKSDGVKFYVIPGSNGRVYWTNLSECSCPDSQHRGESVTCKHRLAVALHVARLQAERSQRRAAPQPRQACGVCDVIHPCAHCPRMEACACPLRSFPSIVDETSRAPRGGVPLVGRITV